VRPHYSFSLPHQERSRRSLARSFDYASGIVISTATMTAIFTSGEAGTGITAGLPVGMAGGGWSMVATTIIRNPSIHIPIRCSRLAILRSFRRRRQSLPARQSDRLRPRSHQTTRGTTVTPVKRTTRTLPNAVLRGALYRRLPDSGDTSFTHQAEVSTVAADRRRIPSS